MATAFTPTVFTPQGQPNYQVNPVAGNQYKPQDGMTQLGQIMDLQGKSLELKKAQELLEPSIEKGKSESKKAQTEAEKSQFELQSIYQKNAQGAVAALQKKILQLKDKDGNFVPNAQQILANDADMVEQILSAQGVPKHPSGALDKFKQAIAKSPEDAENFISYLTQSGGTPESRFAQANPSLTTVGGIPGFATPATQQFTPLNINQAPQGGEEVSGTGQIGGQATPVVPEKIVQETFPNRANTPYVSDTEKPRFDEGVKTLQEAKLIGDAAQTQLNDIRNARKYIKSASGTALGQGSRSLAKLIAENPDLDSLIKSTAQLQMNAASRFGASTDAARETAAAAAGGADISEKALVRILDNAEADLTRDAKYSAGLQKFAQKRGNVGGALNAPDFKQAWINNAKDRKIYQLINLNANTELSNAEKTIIRDELLSHETPATIKALQAQMKAMKKLEQGD
jgi:hypothetical protein